MVSASLGEELSKFSVQAETSWGICLKEAYFSYSIFFFHVYIYRLLSFLLKNWYKNYTNPFILILSFVDT